MQLSSSRKRYELKKLYSIVAYLSSVNDGEFDNLIRSSMILFNKYGIDKLQELASGNVIDLNEYRKSKERL